MGRERERHIERERETDREIEREREKKGDATKSKFIPSNLIKIIANLFSVSCHSMIERKDIKMFPS